jgi:hypothetical protein
LIKLIKLYYFKCKNYTMFSCENSIIYYWLLFHGDFQLFINKKRVCVCVCIYTYIHTCIYTNCFGGFYFPKIHITRSSYIIKLLPTKFVPLYISRIYALAICNIMSIHYLSIFKKHLLVQWNYSCWSIHLVISKI